VGGRRGGGGGGGEGFRAETNRFSLSYVRFSFMLYLADTI